MDQRVKHQPCTALIGMHPGRYVVVLWLTLAGAASTIAAERGGAVDWRGKRAQLEAQVKAYVEGNVTRVSVAKSLGLTWPVQAPEKSLGELRGEQQNGLRRVAADRFPMPDPEAVRAELREHYPPLSVGDKVDFYVPELKGPDSHIMGIITRITPTLIRVGNRWIRPANLPEGTAARFLPEQFDRLMQAEIEKRTRVCKRERESFVIDALEERLPDVFEQAGYRLSDGTWFSARYLVQRQTQYARKKALVQVRNAVMTDNGFEHFRDEWMPRTVVAGILQRELKEKEERQRREELKRRLEDARRRMPVEKTIRELEIDQADFLDKPLIVTGRIDTSTHFDAGYSGARKTHYSYRFVCRSSRTAHLYMERKAGRQLNSMILDTRDGWDAQFIIEIRRDRHHSTVSDVYAEVLEFAPLDAELDMVRRCQQALAEAERVGLQHTRQEKE